MAQSLAIIGGGVAGLAAGCYARMNGYSVTIFEMGATPGGLCTSWWRKGYLFDGSVAGLAGSSSGSPLFRLWQELGIIKYCPLFNGENFGFIHLPEGKIVTVYTDIEKLEKELLSHFPEDRQSIAEFLGALRSVLDLDIPFSDAQGFKGLTQQGAALISSFKHLPALLKYGNMTIRKFSEKFKNPSLSLAFNNIVHFGGPDVPLLTLLLPLAYANRKMAGIPQKGWLDFARAIERRFLELGGCIKYSSKVSGVNIENAAVKGVVLDDGTVFLADRVLSTADGRFSHTLLLGKSDSESVRIFDPKGVSDQPVQVNIGVNEDFSGEKGPVTYVLSDTFKAAGREHGKITVHNKFYDKDAAPEGKSAITVFLDSDYFFWKSIASDKNLYNAEKERCSEAVIEIIERNHPKFRDRVEVVDVSTPLTRERFTGNFLGAMQAMRPSSDIIKALLQGKPQYLYKSIDGLYMAGQWAESWGGITTASQSARKAVQSLCKNDGKRFTSTII